MTEPSLPYRRSPVDRCGPNPATAEGGTVTVPAAVYTDEDRFEQERLSVFRKSWFVVERSSVLAKPGDFFVWSELGETVVVVRHSDGEIHAFHNVCQHRGARIVANVEGYCPQLFTCGWHGFRYDRTGLVRGVPDRDTFDSAALHDLRAPTVAVADWGGWVWINLAGEAAPTLEEWLGEEILEELANYDMADMVLHQTRSWEMPVNWKVVVEGFIEVYHVAETHKRSIGSQLAVEATTQWLFDRHSMYVVPYRDQLRQLEASRDHIRDAISHYLVFPNSLFNCAATHIQFFTPIPIDAHLAKYRVWNLIRPGGDAEYLAHMDTLWEHFCGVAEEDLFAAVQVGATRRSAGYQRNLLNSGEVRLPHFLDNVEKMLTS